MDTGFLTAKVYKTGGWNPSIFSNILLIDVICIDENIELCWKYHWKI
jgi:hypothetical protein